jgi:hypothetical protein
MSIATEPRVGLERPERYIPLTDAQAAAIDATTRAVLQSLLLLRDLADLLRDAGRLTDSTAISSLLKLICEADTSALPSLREARQTAKRLRPD